MDNKKQVIEYETIRGKWWIFINGEPIRELTDLESSNVIWGTNDSLLNNEKFMVGLFLFVMVVMFASVIIYVFS